MQSNKNVKGLAIFSQEEQIRERSLKLYSFLICRSFLRNVPNKYGDNVRIFQQKDINLQEIKRVLGFDPDTTKKYWEGLEAEGLIRFCPRDWQEIRWDEDGNEISFKKRWTVRNKHKMTYYEIPIKQGQLFRKIPKSTLIELNEDANVNELTLKLYITLINFQEECIIENRQYKKFTYKDLRDMIGYKLKSAIDRKIESSLNLLISMGLIEIEKGEFINTYGQKIPCFLLNQANFYINYDIKGFATGEENIVDKDLIERIKQRNKEEYSEAFN